MFEKFRDWLSKPRLVAGIMTGTSLDGIDTALVKISCGQSGHHSIELLGFAIYGFPLEIKYPMLKILSGEAQLSDISMVNFALPQLYSNAVIELCGKSGIEPSAIDAIGCHGQTVWHDPPSGEPFETKTASTLQLGSVPALANLAGITAVGDFRAADIALGGQGAPLVPVFDFNFFRSETEDTIALNIGGIANCTYLPLNCKESDVIAFDSGPGNILIDAAMHRFYSLHYDRDGEVARSGKLVVRLMDELKRMPYICRRPPKSTGRELFNAGLLGRLIEDLQLKELPSEDIVHTLTAFTAWSIAENIRVLLDAGAKLIVSGGGRHNSFLMELLQGELPGSLIEGSESLGIDPDAKEAICFAYLAYRTLGGLCGNLPSVTGASRPAILGIIAIP